MRILSITAGAAKMYCGSCLRDNALAAELIAQGHDVVLAPLYTPTLTDERNVSQERVFFGGISVYLQQHSSLFRKTPWLLDKLWDSRFALKMAARRSIPVDPRMLGEITVSMLKGEDGFQQKEIRKLIAWLESETAPDVVSLPYSLLISLARPIKRALNRPVYCTLQGEDLFLEGLLEPYRTQALELIRANLEYVDGFLAVTQYYADFMTGYLGIPPSKMHVVPLGLNLDGYEPVPRPRSGVFTIGFFARVAPEKGLHLLCDAYRRIRARPDAPPCRLEVAGYLAAEHKVYWAGIEQQMAEWGFANEFRYHGVLDRAGKISFLQSLDVLSVPVTCAEAKGTYVLEAMACGIPVVEPRRGALPEIIAKTGGGIVVEPEDLDALADALLSIRRDPSRAAELGRSGAAGVRKHYNVSAMARRAAEFYSGVRAVPQMA